MAGGLLQLVAYGAQDAYLTGNPQITFWRGLYKRHTNFAMEPFRVNLTGQANWGVKHSAILPRHADLVFNTYLEVELSNEGTLVYDGGIPGLFNMVEYVELDIGGQVIDRLYGEWMYLWSQLTYPSDQRNKLDDLGEGLGPSTTCGSTGRPSRGNLNYIPLCFWFGRNPGAALPLIALQYHEVKINILWNKDTQVFQLDGSRKPESAVFRQANLLIDYVYLDVEERRRMAQESHEYLIEQTQFNEDKGITSANVRLDLTFNHPVKELVWVTQAAWRRDCRIISEEGIISPLNYDNIIYDCALQINGQDRVPSLPRQYYNLVQPYQHHSGTTLSGVHCYSFALRPEEHQPSGTCNFSRIDTATLVFSVDGNIEINNTDVNNYNVRTYAINYNVLRVMSGMAGLSYSN
jgi:hypothetical protein